VLCCVDQESIVLLEEFAKDPESIVREIGEVLEARAYLYRHKELFVPYYMRSSFSCELNVFKPGFCFPMQYLFLETPRVQPYDHPNAKWLKAPWLM
jgi:hypothetical protein